MKQNLFFKKLFLLPAMTILFYAPSVFAQTMGSGMQGNNMKQDKMPMHQQSMMNMDDMMRQIDGIVEHTINMMQHMQVEKQQTPGMEGMMMSNEDHPGMMSMTPEMNAMALNMQQIIQQMHKIQSDNVVMSTPGMNGIMKEMYGNMEEMMSTMSVIIDHMDNNENNPAHTLK